MDLKIFISSPGDVPDERLRADLVIDKLSQDYRRFFTLRSYRWEHEPMLASGHFQDAIEPPSATDILILIVWSRLGTPLPEKTAVRAYRGIDGRAPVTGTEWEFEDALAATLATGSPDILAFRNTRPAPVDTCDPEARAKSLGQLDALDAFWRRHFADKGVFIGAFEGYRTLEEFAELFEQKLRKLLERRVALPATKAAAAIASTWIGSPFRGLEAYEFEHAPIFFGRDATVADAARHLAMAARHDNAFLLIAGGSGSGKSSLVKAALVPRLMRPQRIEGLAFLRRVVFRPSDARTDLVSGFAAALAEDRRTAGIGLPELLAPGQTATDLATYLRAVADNPAFVFAAAIARVTDSARFSGLILGHEQARVILVVDQLEEVFTRDAVSAHDRSIFVRLIAGLAASGLVWVIATMRSDFWHRTAESPELLALAAGERRIDLAAPSPLELADMIRKPVEVAGLAFEVDPETGTGLDAELARRASDEPGVLPLLSFTLEAIFAEDIVKAGGHTLTHATYKALGRLEGAIATRAEDIVHSLPEAARKAVPRVLRALTTVSDGLDAIAVARTAPIDSFPVGTDPRRVVDAFVAGRLLVASGDGKHATVRVAHEALLGHWKRASDQIALDRRDLETRKLVERQFERWSQAADAAGATLLLRDPDLTNAIDLEARWGDDLEANHRAFVRRSARAAQSAVRRRWVAAAVVMALLAALSALSIGGLAVAERQRDMALTAQSRALARDATAASVRGDTTLAMLLALAALPDSLHNPERPFVLDAAYPLANAFANRRERALVRHAGIINAIAFSPNGQVFATASDDRTAVIWTAATGHRETTLVGHTAPLNSIEFSHDGLRVVTASDDGTARVWDAASGKPIAVLTAQGAQVVSATFSRDDARVAIAMSDGAAALFDARSGVRGATLRIPDTRVLSAVFSPDGTKVATASDDAVARLWATDGTLLHELPYLGGTGTAIAFSSDGRRLVCASDDGTARIWDVATFAPVSSLLGHAARINSAVFSPDGRAVLTSSDDHTARLWNPETGATTLALLGHDGIVYSAAFSADGTQVITASEDKTARVWDTRNGFVTAVLGGHEAPVLSAVFAPDGRSLATGSHEPVAHLWNADSSATIGVLRGDAKVKAAAFSPDGARVATGSDDGVLRVWDSRGIPLATWRGRTASIRTVEFSPDGHLIVTASADKVARLWEVTNGTIRRLEGHDGPINSARFSPDGLQVVTGSDDQTARIWTVATGLVSHVLPHKGSVSDALFSPDGAKVVTTASDGSGRLWDAASGALIATLEGHTTFVKSAAFSPDGDRIATAAGDGARLWDGKTGRPVAVLGVDHGTVTAVAFSPDGRMVATGSLDHEARLWDAQDGRFLRAFTGHDLPVRSVAFSPDNQRLLTASDDRTSRYWDIATGHTIAVFPGHEDGVTSAKFAPDGRAFVTVSSDATARLWSVPPFCQPLIDASRRTVSRGLTADEQARFFLGATAGGGWNERLHFWSAPLLALIVPRSGDLCR